MPTPVGQADNRDGPRLMCGLGLGPVTGHHPRFFRFAYFEYVTRQSCAGRVPYPSSELVPLEIGRLLTPVLGLSGDLNLIAVGVLWCALASVGDREPGRRAPDHGCGPNCWWRPPAG